MNSRQRYSCNDKLRCHFFLVQAEVQVLVSEIIGTFALFRSWQCIVVTFYLYKRLDECYVVHLYI